MEELSRLEQLIEIYKQREDEFARREDELQNNLDQNPEVVDEISDVQEKGNEMHKELVKYSDLKETIDKIKEYNEKIKGENDDYVLGIYEEELRKYEEKFAELKQGLTEEEMEIVNEYFNGVIPQKEQTENTLEQNDEIEEENTLDLDGQNKGEDTLSNENGAKGSVQPQSRYKDPNPSRHFDERVYIDVIKYTEKQLKKIKGFIDEYNEEKNKTNEEYNKIKNNLNEEYIKKRRDIIAAQEPDLEEKLEKLEEEYHHKEKLNEDQKTLYLAAEEKRIMKDVKYNFSLTLKMLDRQYQKGAPAKDIYDALKMMGDFKLDDQTLQRMIDEAYLEVLNNYPNLISLSEHYENNKPAESKDPIESGETGDPDSNPDSNPEQDPEPELPDPTLNEDTFENVPELPEDIHQEPKKTWKTWVSLAAGIGLGVGTYFVAGPIGVGVVAIGGSILKRLVAKKRNEIKMDRVRKENEYKQIQMDIKATQEKIQQNMMTLNILKATIEGVDNPERKQQLTDMYNQLAAQTEQMSQGIAQAKQRAEAVAESLTVTEVEEPAPGIKGIATRIKNYFKSEEGLRNTAWFLNGAVYSSIATNVIAPMLGAQPIYASKQPQEPTPEPKNETTQDPTPTPKPNPDPTPEPKPDTIADTNPTAGEHFAGSSASDLNLTHGHDQASWAGAGMNKEVLDAASMHNNPAIRRIFVRDPSTGMTMDVTSSGRSMESLISEHGAQNVIGEIGIGPGSTLDGAFINGNELGLGGVSI